MQTACERCGVESGGDRYCPQCQQERDEAKDEAGGFVLGREEEEGVSLERQLERLKWEVQRARTVLASVPKYCRHGRLVEAEEILKMIDPPKGLAVVIMEAAKAGRDAVHATAPQGTRFRVSKVVEKAILAMGSEPWPWPLKDVLRRLIEATKHLFSVHGCDVHGHEEIQRCVIEGEKYLGGVLDVEEE